MSTNGQYPNPGDFMNILQTAMQSGNKDIERAMYQSIANSMNPSLMEYVRGGGIEQRVNRANLENQQRQNQEGQLTANKGGMEADPSGSGMLRAKGAGRLNTSGSSSGSGIGTSALKPAGGQPDKNYQRDMQDFERSMYESGQVGKQQNALSIDKQRQEQALKMEMLQKIMMQFKGGRGSGNGAGYTEQIFNNAGAPQVVRLQNQDSGQNQQMLMQLLSRFGG